MTNAQLLKGKTSASLVLVAVLMFVSSASATLTSTADNTNSASAFTPAWPVASVNLIAGLLPTDSFGNFTQESAGGLSKLTDGAIGPVTGTAIFATCGNNGGRMAIYDLPASANGFNITNITTYTGWGNGGRHAQAYTLYYSTKAAPRKFILLGSIAYAGGFTGNNPAQPSANRVIWADSTAGATIAANAAAIMFDFNTPTSNGENGYSGYAEITVEGTAAVNAMPQVVAIAKSNTNGAAPFNPGWTLETPSLIAGMATSTATGNFGQESPTVVGSRDVNSLTANGDLTISADNILANNNNTTSPNYVTCGGSGGTSLIYTLTNSVNGSDVTNIVVYSGWADSGRHGQYYTVSYSTVGQPTSFIPISTVFYLPTVPGATPSANRVAISSLNGVPLGSAVASLKFDFASPPAAGAFNNGYQGYAQIIVQGQNTTAPPPPPSPYLTQDTLPTYAETVVGDQVVFTAAYSNVPPANLQWQVIKAGVTNNVPGATSSTLTLNNVQVSDSGLYRLKADNATNILAATSYSAARQLLVGSTPAAVNNVIVNYAGQSFPSTTNYFPTWPVDTNSLVYGFIIGSGPGTFTSAGDFAAGNSCNADPTILSDGVAASITSVPTPLMVAGGPTINSVGSSITYTLITDSAPNGFSLTNITVFGGWQDGGRNQQKYQILYATVTAPTSFVPLITADYNPNDPANEPSVTRTRLTPATGVLAQNVVAVKLSFDLSPGPKNGWEGYSEFIVQGTPSAGIAPNLVRDTQPSTATDIVGGQIVISSVFSNYTSLQWKKNGTNIPGATTATLTLDNLTTNDSASYTLVASNPSGSTGSGSCMVTVNPAPTPVGNILTTIAAQTCDDQIFAPTWSTNTLGASLISGLAPSSVGPGDFSGGNFGSTLTACSDPSVVLTDGTFGTADFYITTAHLNWTAMGTGTGTGNSFGGQSVTYTLPASANGYTITNIMTAAGWNDAGRDHQAYTVLYSTLQNPDIFLPIGTVDYNPSSPVGYSLTRATLTPVSGALATNVKALKFDMNFPRGENGFSGYSEFAVYGTPTPTPPAAVPVITAQNEQGSFSYVVETDNLIANQLPASFGPGVFTEEGCNVTNLTDGAIGFGAAFGASCGADGTAVPWIVFNSATGWDLTNIVVYSLWNDYGRDGQFYQVSYSTWYDPTTFLPLATVYYNPDVPQNGTASANRVAIAPSVGATLATNVAAVKFDFTSQGIQDYSWSGYSEIVLQGSNLALPKAPTINPPTVSGGNLILTGTGGSPANSGYTLLTATNLSAPINWTTNATGALVGGAFSNAIPVNAAESARFFKMRIP